VIGAHKSEKSELGAQAWELLWDLVKVSKPYIESIAAEFDLTPQQMFALKTLSNDQPLAMSDLATTLSCDASNVTAIVDKLESHGYVERRSADYDRRVKALIMTPAGTRLQQKVRQRMLKPPPAIDRLSLADQRALRDILRRAIASIEIA
jgi:DNA-binding MarR family transcriptional regulator